MWEGRVGEERKGNKLVFSGANNNPIIRNIMKKQIKKSSKKVRITAATQSRGCIDVSLTDTSLLFTVPTIVHCC